MKTTKNTVLVTGGSAGIGLEIARLLVAQDNTVIITGRNEERLTRAAALSGNIIPFRADVTSAADVETLRAEIERNYPELNILINNAGYAEAYELGGVGSAWERAGREMDTNYLSVIRMTDALLPVLLGKPDAAVVNVTSVVAFFPAKILPTYSAIKAALHVYTDLLRQGLDGRVEVYELIPPLVNTEFSKAIGGEKGIPASEVAEELLQAFKDRRWSVPVGPAREWLAKIA
ncbi:MAG: SDR family NAD(P)-dependent oxidoreductase [Bacteroidia bacterium]|nr:SDR family NAD(P)-dependent oxidoreductase [Bacteroidia bacterium]